MENQPKEVRVQTELKNHWMKLPEAISQLSFYQILKTGATLLIFGVVVIILKDFDQATGELIPSLDPIPFAGGAVLLVALTVLGVPLIPAAVAGVAGWWVIDSFMSGSLF